MISNISLLGLHYSQYAAKSLTSRDPALHCLAGGFSNILSLGFLEREYDKGPSSVDWGLGLSIMREYQRKLSRSFL